MFFTFSGKKLDVAQDAITLLGQTITEKEENLKEKQLRIDALEKKLNELRKEMDISNESLKKMKVFSN